MKKSDRCPRITHLLLWYQLVCYFVSDRQDFIRVATYSFVLCLIMYRNDKIEYLNILDPTTKELVAAVSFMMTLVDN